MSKLVPLLSKTFTGGEVQNDFIATSSKLTLIVEKRENILGIQLQLKGRKEMVPVHSTHNPATNVHSFELLKGESYRISTSSSLETERQEDGTYKDKPSLVEISGHWGVGKND